MSAIQRFFAGIGSTITGIVIAILVIILLIILFKKGYIKAPPNKAVVISGRRKEPRIVVGKAGLCIPFLERRDELTLQVVDIDVKTEQPVPTKDFIGVQVDATVNVKIPSDKPDMVQIAAQNFLNMRPEEIARLVQPVLEGNIREIIGNMNLKDMVSDRQAFSDLVKQNAEPDLKNLGLEIKTFNVQNFSDDQGVIKALGVDNEAQIKKDAAVSKARNSQIIREETAKAEQAANQAEVASKTAIAERENLLRIRRAELKQESDSRQAEADAAYAINQETQRKQLEQRTIDADIARQEREIELEAKRADAEKQRLSAEIEKKADAERYAAQQRAEADLFTRQKEAEAKKIEQQRVAEAQAYQAQKDAEAQKALAEAAKYAKEQEAAGIKAVGEAEAAAIAAKGVAEAEAIERKAEAMQKYGQAAILEMVVNVLPQVAHEVASPMGNIESVKIIGGDAQGVSGMSNNVPVVMAKVFESVKSATGIDLSDIVRGQGEHAAITKNLTIAGQVPAIPVQDVEE